MTYTRSSGSPPEPGFLVMSIEFQILFITYEKTITKKILKSKPLKLALRPLSFILLHYVDVRALASLFLTGMEL